VTHLRAVSSSPPPTRKKVEVGAKMPVVAAEAGYGAPDGRLARAGPCPSSQ
jgi:hypothetical protein